MQRRSIQSDMADEDGCEAREEAASMRACVELPTPAAMETLATDPTQTIGESDFHTLLKDFAIEPDSDEGRATKFKLYEDYVETVASSRVDTLQFWSTCRADFVGTGDGSTAVTVDRSVKAIDHTVNLSINFEASCWFVHSMIKKADENEKMIQRVLSTIKTKVDLLSRHGDCPICLESLKDEDATVLGCCHKVCNGCWAHWKKAKYGRAFCPICRHEDFVAEIANMAAVDLAAAAAGAPAVGGTILTSATIPTPAPGTIISVPTDSATPTPLAEPTAVAVETPPAAATGAPAAGVTADTIMTAPTDSVALTPPAEPTTAAAEAPTAIGTPM